MLPEKPKKRAKKITDDVFASVIRAFLRSKQFDQREEGGVIVPGSLSSSTQDNYRYLLKLAENPDGLGSVPIDEMRPALVQGFLDGLAKRPAKQRNARVVLKALEKWAIVRDLLPRPITLGTETDYKDDEGHTPWTDEQVAYAERYLPPYFAKVITLASNTGQRGSDLVRMRATDIEVIDGHPGINVKQQKTGVKVWVPFTQTLIAAMATWERRPGYLLLKANGTPWTERKHMSARWAKLRNTPAMKAFKEAGLVLHGLRGTAVIRLRRAGATIPQICDMVGMSPAMVKRYCRHSDQQENALAAVHILDRTATERSRKVGSYVGSKT